MKNYKISIFLMILFTVSGCSKADIFGGSDKGNSGASSSCGEMNSPSCEMFKAVNSYRQSQGHSPLAINSRCIRMAQDHAVDMVERDFFSHESPNETFGQRANRYQLSYYVGENIAMGSDSVQSVLSMWKNSSGHNANMLNAGYASTGLGYYQGRWVQCFSGEAK